MIKRSGLTAIATALGIALLLPPLAHAKARSFGIVSGWDRYTLYDEDGSQWACAADETRDRVSFGMLINDESALRLYLYSDDWMLGEDEIYDIAISIDSFRRRNVTAIVYGEHGVIFTSPEDPQFIAALHEGSTAHIYTEQQTFNFPLQGSSITLQWISQCINAAIGQGGSGKKRPR
jgi:hypothetical protein